MTKTEQIECALKFLKGKGWNIKHQPRTGMYVAESTAKVHYVDWIDLVMLAEVEGWSVAA